MLTLTGQHTVAGCQIYADDTSPFLWYVLPQSPRVARDENGVPIISMVWYRRPLDRLTEEERRTKLGGGILGLSVDLAPTPQQVEEIKKSIANNLGVQGWRSARSPEYQTFLANRRPDEKLEDRIVLSAVPLRSGEVTIAVLGEPAGAPAGSNELVSSLVGAGTVSMTGDQRASFMAKLTLDGAVLLWEMLEKNLAAIRVAYDLKFHHRLDDVEMTVFCDARRSYDLVQRQWRQLQEDASFRSTYSGNSSSHSSSQSKSDSAGDVLHGLAVSSETSGVRVSANDPSVSAELLTELQKSGHDMLKDFLAATFLTFDPQAGLELEKLPEAETSLPSYDSKKYGHHGISQFRLKEWHQSMEASLNHTFRSSTVLEHRAAPNDNIANVLGGLDVDTFRTKIDIDADWLKYLDVNIFCTSNFQEEPVDSVTVHVKYEASGSEGTVNKAKTFVFKGGSPPQSFSTFLAGPALREYEYDVKVYYRGSSATYEVNGKSEENVLVLDTDTLGILRVNTQVGLIDWTRIKQISVQLSYGAGPTARSTQFSLDEKRQSQLWVVPVGAPIDQNYTAKITYIDINDQRLEMDPIRSRSRELVLDYPLQSQLEVKLIPTGTFGQGGLQRIAVTLRYQDTPNDYFVTNNFDMLASRDSGLWQVPLINKKLRTYDYQVTVVYSDGVERSDGWKTTDRNILTVGDPFGWRVKILPYLLKNPPYVFATVQLAFADAAASINAETTLEIKDYTTPQTWLFRLGAPDRHRYQYRLRLFRSDGTEVETSGEADEEVLVLKPSV